MYFVAAAQIFCQERAVCGGIAVVTDGLVYLFKGVSRALDDLHVLFVLLLQIGGLSTVTRSVSRDEHHIHFLSCEKVHGVAKLVVGTAVVLLVIHMGIRNRTEGKFKGAEIEPQLVFGNGGCGYRILDIGSLFHKGRFRFKNGDSFCIGGKHFSVGDLARYLASVFCADDKSFVVIRQNGSSVGVIDQIVAARFSAFYGRDGDLALRKAGESSFISRKFDGDGCFRLGCKYLCRIQTTSLKQDDGKQDG